MKIALIETVDTGVRRKKSDSLIFTKRRNTMISNSLCTGLILFLLAGIGYAQGHMGRDDMPSHGQQNNGLSRVPPQVAIDVCTGKSEGTSCEFTDPRGSKTGTCVYTPDKKYYACRPNDMPSHGRQEGQGRGGQRN